MKTIPRDDMLAKVADRTAQEDYEKFKRDTCELAREQHQLWEARKRRTEESVSTENLYQATESPT